MKIIRTAARGALALALVVTAGMVAAPAAAHAPASHHPTAPGGHHGTLLRDLVKAYVASGPYHDVDRATADGFTDVTGCLEFSNGYPEDEPIFGPGAMGHHFLKQERVDGVLDASNPEILLYETKEDGTLRLTGVEYIIPGNILPPDADPPVLFGRELMYHHQFGVWGLHVWLWKHNPYGLFADVNPRVTCEFAD